MHTKTTFDVNKHYATIGTAGKMRYVRNLSELFFEPPEGGYVRRDYIRQMLKVTSFTIEGKPDYEFDVEDSGESLLEKRIENVAKLLKQYSCICFEQNERVYGYSSEYLAIILLDCFVSALKAGKDWNVNSWGGEAFYKLDKKVANEKCKIEMYREKGGEYAGQKYDYFVIKNIIYSYLRTSNKGIGMSQASTKWYIESAWQFFKGEGQGCPEVITEPRGNEYTIKLPILNVKGEI